MRVSSSQEMRVLKDLPQSQDEGWKKIGEVVQVRKVSDGLFMMRQGAEGTAVAVTAQQLENYLARLTDKRRN